MKNTNASDDAAFTACIKLYWTERQELLRESQW